MVNFINNFRRVMVNLRVVKNVKVKLLIDVMVPNFVVIMLVNYNKIEWLFSI